MMFEKISGPNVDLSEDDTLYGRFRNPELLGVRCIISARPTSSAST